MSTGTRRIVSLVPSITETLLAWDVPVAACTRFCEQPDLPHVGGTKNPDLEAIVALAPDVVLMDTEENRREDAEALAARGITVVATEVHSLDDVPVALDRIAAACDVERPVDTGSSAAVAPPRDEWRSALVLIWRRPWMAVTGATYAASLLAALGITTVPPGPERYPQVDLASTGLADAGMVLVPSEPYTFTDAHVAEIVALMPRADVRRVDGRDLFWWGARTPGAIARLGATLA